MRIAILDDFHGIAARLAEFRNLPAPAHIDAISEHIADPDALVARLKGCAAVVMMRERTPLPRSIIERLPDLRLIVTAGMQNRSLDVEAATEHGIQVCGTEMRQHATAELTWGLILALVRHIPEEDRAIRTGQWQTSLGHELKDKTLGIVGLGRLGARIAAVGRAFGLNVIAWSQNLTEERALQHGVRHVEKNVLFAQSDIISIHLVLSDRTRGLVGAEELALMKPSAYLVNTSRALIVDQPAFLDSLRNQKIAGAGLDVFEIEPVTPDNPFLQLKNTVLTPHIGFTVEENYELVYRQAAEAICAFLVGESVRPINTVTVDL